MPTAAASKNSAPKSCSSANLSNSMTSTGLSFPEVSPARFSSSWGRAGFDKLKEFVRAKPTFGTCAGAILLAAEVENPTQAGLGALDIRIRRNAYGRQIDSSIREGKFFRNLEGKLRISARNGLYPRSQDFSRWQGS